MITWCPWLALVQKCCTSFWFSCFAFVRELDSNSGVVQLLSLQELTVSIVHIRTQTKEQALIVTLELVALISPALMVFYSIRFGREVAAYVLCGDWRCCFCCLLYFEVCSFGRVLSSERWMDHTPLTLFFCGPLGSTWFSYPLLSCGRHAGTTGVLFPLELNPRFREQNY